MWGDLFGDKILHQSEPSFKTFLSLYVLKPFLPLARFASPSCDRLAKRGGKGLDKGWCVMKNSVFIGLFASFCFD